MYKQERQARLAMEGIKRVGIKVPVTFWREMSDSDLLNQGGIEISHYGVEFSALFSN